MCVLWLNQLLCDWFLLAPLSKYLKKDIYAEVFKTDSVSDALAINTVKLCITPKTDAPLQQCSKSHALV